MKSSNMEEEISNYLLKEYNKLYRLAYSYVHNSDDAMDIVQESAYKAIRAKDHVREEAYIATWIYRIIVNTSLDFLKKHKREIVGIEDYEEGREDQYTNFDIMDSLKSLNEQDRLVIILRFFEDMKFTQISEVTGEPVNTIKTRLYRALKKLKVDLAKEMEA